MTDSNQKNDNIINFTSNDEYLNHFVEEIKKNPYELNKSIRSITSMISIDEFEKLEVLLQSRIPGLIITHHETDTPEDLSKQLMKVKEIYNTVEHLYFVDLSEEQHYVKKMKKNKS